MGHEETYEIVDRRNKVLTMLNDDLSTKEIAKSLNVNIDTMYKDKQAIRKKSASFISKSGVNGLAYYYDTLVQDIQYARRKAKTIVEDPEELTSDKIKALNTFITTITEHRELLKESMSFTQIEVLIKEVEVLKQERVNQLPTTDNYMPGLPSITNEDTPMHPIHDSIEVTNNNDVDNNS